MCHMSTCCVCILVFGVIWFAYSWHLAATQPTWTTAQPDTETPDPVRSRKLSVLDLVSTGVRDHTGKPRCCSPCNCCALCRTQPAPGRAVSVVELVPGAPQVHSLAGV